MAKARRDIGANLRYIDVVAEVIDARIPSSSRNPDVPGLCGDKPRIIVLNRTDLADPNATRQWLAHFKRSGTAAIETDCRSGRGVSSFAPAVRALISDKLESRARKGQAGRPVRAMVLGIPNVGKSAFINKAAKKKAAKVSDKPGVTRGRQWVTVDAGMELLDTPGILWPKLDSGEMLAFTGAIRDETLDTEELGARLLKYLLGLCPDAVFLRYGVLADESSGFEALRTAAKRRAFLRRGGEEDTERMAAVLLDEFRAGALGRITLELPEER